MATTPLSLLQTQEQNITHLGSNPSKLGTTTTTTTTTSQRGRKPNNGGNNQAKKKKKIPQRGLGVAQLEMLRLQELRKSQQVENSLTINPKPTQQATPFHQYYCNLGYNNINNGRVGSGRVLSNPFNVGGADVPYHVFETSTELTSMPKMMVMIMCPTKRQHFEACDLLSSDVCFKGFEGIPIICWKGSSVDEGVVLMEHEFFPVKNCGSTNPKEMEFGSEALGAIGGEAKFCLTTSDCGGCSASNVSNYVDLSLKL